MDVESQYGKKNRPFICRIMADSSFPEAVYNPRLETLGNCSVFKWNLHRAAGWADGRSDIQWAAVMPLINQMGKSGTMPWIEEQEPGASLRKQ